MSVRVRARSLKDFASYEKPRHARFWLNTKLIFSVTLAEKFPTSLPGLTSLPVLQHQLLVMLLQQ